MPSEQIFPFGAEGKGGTPPLPRRKREKMPEGIEYPMNKPIIQVYIELEGELRRLDRRRSVT